MNTPWFLPISGCILKVKHPTSLKEKSIFKGLNKSRTSPERSTIPSWILVATLDIEIIISSNKVEDLPSGNTRGTGENNLPKAEY